MPDKITLPLAGIRILDLSYVFAVPYMASLLGDLGAEVIKIEAPHRLDQTRGRAFGPYLDNEIGQDPWNRSGIFQVVNRGKKSLVLNMAEPAGREIFLQLMEKSDVVLDNYTPRVMRKWGVNYEELRKRKPSLIMLSNTGYGSTGPWHAFPSQGTTLEATMGITYYTGYRNGKPWKAGQSYPDFLACWTGLNAIFAALIHRRRTGEGQWIDLGMYQVGAALIADQILQTQLTGSDQERMGNEHPKHVPSNIYPALGDNRWLAISVCNDSEWKELAGLMSQPQLAEDERFSRAASRRLHRAEIDMLVSDWVKGQNAEHLADLLQSKGIAAGPVFNSKDLLLNKHLRHRQFYEYLEHQSPIGLRPIISRPYRLKFRKPHIHKSAPKFGEDNRRILTETLGLCEQAIDHLYETRTISDKPTGAGRAAPLNLEQSMKLGTITGVDEDYQSILGLTPGDKAGSLI